MNNGLSPDGHQPDLAAARFRAESLRKLRAFFSERDVLEVETPILSRGVSLDCHIDFFSAQFHPLGFARPGAASEAYHMQTSPEPHMKRLLCHGFPDIYQIGKAFRNGESGSRHNPEFTMVEWYRRGFPLARLMDEVEAVCLLISGSRPVLHKTYAEAFGDALDLDPFTLDPERLHDLPALAGKLPEGHRFHSRSDALDYLMAHIVEPGFDPAVLTIIREFPAEQAAQSRIHSHDPRVAHRFEVYGGGMELGNGYLELIDPAEYAKRFDQENVKRRTAGKPELTKDRNLLADLQRGLPDCAGVAMGFDRLVMLGLGHGEIGSVLAFPWEAC